MGQLLNSPVGSWFPIKFAGSAEIKAVFSTNTVLLKSVNSLTFVSPISSLWIVENN